MRLIATIHLLSRYVGIIIDANTHNNHNILNTFLFMSISFLWHYQNLGKHSLICKESCWLLYFHANTFLLLNILKFFEAAISSYCSSRSTLILSMQYSLSLFISWRRNIFFIDYWLAVRFTTHFITKVNNILTSRNDMLRIYFM